jgi:hypothetical protein
MQLMPRSWPVIALTLVGCVGLGVLSWRPAIGAPHAIKAANWSGGAVFTGGGKQFDRCSATSTNAKGMAITYAMDSQLRWSLAISNPDWTFTDDFSLSINLSLDGRPFRGRALVRESKWLLIQVDDQIALFAGLRMAAQLRATAGGLVIEFDLANSSEALSAVAQCALRQGSSSASGGPKNPAKGKSIRVESVPDAGAQKEVLGFANAIKGHASIGGFRVLPVADSLPGSLAAVGWSAESAAGVVMIVPPNTAARPGEVKSRAIEYEQRKCRGEYFFASDIATLEQAEVARVYVACKMPESTAITYYTAVPRTKGGAYVVTNASGQGFALILQRQTETADGKLRGAILEALRRFDQGPEARERPADGSE